jgi:hypothetical protein
MNPKFLTPAEVLAIHQDPIARYGGASGIRDIDSLKSAPDDRCQGDPQEYQPILVIGLFCGEIRVDYSGLTATRVAISSLLSLSGSTPSR